MLHVPFHRHGASASLCAHLTEGGPQKLRAATARLEPADSEPAPDLSVSRQMSPQVLCEISGKTLETSGGEGPLSARPLARCRSTRASGNQLPSRARPGRPRSSHHGTASSEDQRAPRLCPRTESPSGVRKVRPRAPADTATETCLAQHCAQHPTPCFRAFAEGHLGTAGFPVLRLWPLAMAKLVSLSLRPSLPSFPDCQTVPTPPVKPDMRRAAVRA